MRVHGVFQPSDHPAFPDPHITELFATLFPGIENPKFDSNHTGLAITAYNPQLALHFAKLSRFLAHETAWCRRSDLRELAIQSVNLHFNSDFSFDARVPNAHAAGLTDAQLAALREWRTSDLFDEEQRLVIEYANAVATGAVPSGLFARAVQRYGETETVEFTSLVAVWSAWAMIINATHAEP
jgi:alkylhydroperoxidase family enzyme